MKRWLNKGKLSIYMWCRPPLKWNLFKGHKGFYPMNKIFHDTPEKDWFIFAKYVANGNQKRNKGIDSTAYKAPKSPNDGKTVNYGSFNASKFATGNDTVQRGPSYWDQNGNGDTPTGKKLYFNQKDRQGDNNMGKGGISPARKGSKGGGKGGYAAVNSPYGGAQPYDQATYGSAPVGNGGSRGPSKGNGKQMQ